MNLKLINKLPISIIINEIEPFTRITIPKDLCNDIKNYKTSLVFIYKRICNSLLETLSMTENYSNCHLSHLLIIARMAWFFLELEVFSFLCRNAQLADVLGRGYCSIQITNIFRYTHELNEVSSIEELDKFSDFIEKNYSPVKSRIQRIWGLMNIQERTQYINDV